jgi:hypothetical protein
MPEHTSWRGTPLSLNQNGDLHTGIAVKQKLQSKLSRSGAGPAESMACPVRSSALAIGILI